MIKDNLIVQIEQFCQERLKIIEDSKEFLIDAEIYDEDEFNETVESELETINGILLIMKGFE